MLPRWPDGSIFVEDPHAAARRLEAERPGWRVWWGDKTRQFWAIERGRAGRMVEAETIDALAERTSNTSTAQPTPMPAPSAPRGRGAPVSGHSGRGALRG